MERTGGARLAAKDVMSKTAREETEHGYRRNLRELQIELVKFQRQLIKRGDRFGHLLMFGQGGFLDHADTVANITLFAKEVMPRLRELNAPPMGAEPAAAQ
jgi:hypothetical protein